MRLALVLLASLAAVSAWEKKLTFMFDPDYSGIFGRINMEYDLDHRTNEVKITADLKFQSIDTAALTKAEPKCSGKVTEFAWHIHTKWQQPTDYLGNSAKLAQCSKGNTANHYDPYRSCGPASDYVDAPECAGRPANYKCTPSNYMTDPWFCEVGDLSGKFGRFKPNKKGQVSAMWVDKNFPTWLIRTTGWSIVIHAVCGDTTPRVACAAGFDMKPIANNKKSLGKDAPEANDGDSLKKVGETETEGGNGPVTYEMENKHLRIQISVKNDDN